MNTLQARSPSRLKRFTELMRTWSPWPTWINFLINIVKTVTGVWLLVSIPHTATPPMPTPDVITQSVEVCPDSMTCPVIPVTIPGPTLVVINITVNVTTALPP